MAKIRNNIPFLLNQIVSRVHAESTEEFRKLGFNLQSGRVLIVLLQNPGANIGTLAEITTIDLSTLSHMLARMSRQKLLERRRDEADTRYVTVHLTPEGTRLALGCKKASDDRERRMLKGIPQAEIDALRGTLSKIFETVRSDSWTHEIEALRKTTRRRKAAS
jgi:DNA-binding MarR family transcriptional regulator